MNPPLAWTVKVFLLGRTCKGTATRLRSDRSEVFPVKEEADEEVGSDMDANWAAMAAAAVEHAIADNSPQTPQPRLQERAAIRNFLTARHYGTPHSDKAPRSHARSCCARGPD